ncbi:DNA-binding response regulator [Haloferula helveola]|uniref:DNA-binding response regulator n=1 Tax=Haloferula helveola TaxID=490095 RepID=A0ABM7RC51_9BACT|nr:DNA-binding response regulator [Haloferula helveola]
MNAQQILLIEDHAVYRQTIRKTLDATGDYRCVGEFSNLEDAFEAIDAGLGADIILLDLGLPAMGGIEGIGKLREKLPEARVIILTAFTDRAKVFAALEAGAHGYLVKAGSPMRLLQTLNEVVGGGTPLDPQIAGMLLDTFQKLRPIAEEESLAPREKEVLQLVARGLTKQQVADELGISLHSVSGYLRRAFDKLHVHSLPAAVSAAIRRGLLDFS